MQKIDEILLVDNNQSSHKAHKEAIVAAGICGNFKTAMNGGHAMLCVNHMHLSGSIANKKMVVLLNIDTPIENGFVFLQQYFKSNSTLQKDRILVVVMDEHLSAEKKHKAQMIGVNHFINSPADIEGLGEMIKTYFKTPDNKRRKKKVEATAAAENSQLRVA
jgi:DNA-binding NtrC family response regulator